MNLLENTIREKKELYKLAVKYFQNINPDEYENITFDDLAAKSISILIDHDFIPTPCIEIRLELLRNQKRVATYFVYVNENREFIDEFLT
ncbi:hypothetical protein [Flavobacterium hungaricum]|uniref:Uncharacterized protein n=1 Tax=Flavobacterium hungaricum TaxID=2082725 RepID=A0ABR9TP97_9FLAO|nr:hypothetical protein [Flavobacterium hungaricum]MBE8727181.1 hypothetical protein [Flavobacterium hungaricum]